MEGSTERLSDGDGFKTASDRRSITGRATSQSRLSFFSFPAEIRNVIMHLILIPGSIHLRRPEDHHTRSSGFSFLATCRQAYEEGRALFYGLNTLYMVPGSLEHTLQYFDILRPENRALIKTLGTEFTFGDADATWAARIESDFEECPREDIALTWALTADRGAWILYALIWQPKVVWLRDQQTNVILRTFNTNPHSQA